MSRIVVDRVVGDVAVLEIAGQMVEIPSSLLPENTREGEMLVFQRTSNSSVLAESEARLERLKAASPQGPDIIDL